MNSVFVCNLHIEKFKGGIFNCTVQQEILTEE